MKNLRIVSACGLLALAIIGCTSAFPNPEVEITKADPPALTGVNEITFTFKNLNNVDAVITRERLVCRGANTQTINTDMTFYIPAKDSSDLILTWDSTALNTLRAAIGYDANNMRTMTFTYSGTDAYGNNKTFTVRDFTISF
jgi:hypothetical protein